MENERNRTHSRYAEFRAGLNNKFYEVEAAEQDDGRATLVFRWGRIGSTGQTKEGVAYSFERAKRDCDDQFQKKLDKGYVEVTAMQALAAAALDVEDRPVNGLPPVEITIPNFGAGPSEERCQTFARKYLDKMNVIRKSKNDLGRGYFDQMTSVLDGFRDEWIRMKSSSAHAVNLAHQQAEDGYEEIRGALRRYGLLSESRA